MRLGGELEKRSLAKLGLDGAQVNVIAVGHGHGFGRERGRTFLNHAGFGYCL
jgi:hypothetical protein